MDNKILFAILGLTVIVAATVVLVNKDNQDDSQLGFLSRNFNVIVSMTEEWTIASNFNTSTDWGSTVNNDYTTTTIYAYKRSIYRPTSSDGAMWEVATSTAGTPSKILDDAGNNRRYAEICWVSGAKLNIFLSNSTSADMLYGRGIPMSSSSDSGYYPCYTIDSDNLWQGAVWGMAYATSFDPAATAHPPAIISITEAK